MPTFNRKKRSLLKAMLSKWNSVFPNSNYRLIEKLFSLSSGKPLRTVSNPLAYTRECM